MNLKEIKEIISLMEEHGLSEIEIEKGDQKIKLRKNQKPGSGLSMEQPIAIQQFQQPANSVQQAPSQESKAKNLVEIKAPIVGTFYRSPSPDAAAFVEAGQEIEVGQVVCIIEAMKLMNEIKSEVRGKVIDILVENADPIEFGQILFLIEPL
jgi:acetyl-CoA carboxylase biotin carboxyl carrier protein